MFTWINVEVDINMWFYIGVNLVVLLLFPIFDLSFQISSPDDGFESKSLYESWLEKDPSSENKTLPR